MGVDLDALTKDDIGEGGAALPDIQPDLVHLCDADIGAYEVADLDKTDVENYSDFVEWIEYRRLLCGAYRSIPFITVGSKGGRYDLAVVKEYQGKRNSNRDPDLAARVHALRSILADRDSRCVVGEVEEADDLLTQYQFASLSNRSIGTLKPNDRTIIDSIDKDLRMSAGLHLCPKEFVHIDVHGYGNIWLDETTSTKKILGWGTSFFWAQMLVGDGADNIPGLPMLSGSLANQYQPTKPIAAAMERINAGLRTYTQKQLDAANKQCALRKPLKVGPVLAYAILKEVTCDSEAMQRVQEAYYTWYGPGSFEVQHWNDSRVKKTAGHMLLEQARLLWMRRVPGECVTTFFKEVKDANWIE